MREFALLERLTAALVPRRADTRLGIGDDAAIIAPSAGNELAVTTDTLIAGRHFPADTPAYDVGWKALAVSLSDLAAMAAWPAWATVALSLPRLHAEWCDAFVDGARAAIGDAAVDLVGGDTTRGPTSVTVTAIGTLAASTAVRRAGARVGDVVAVTGTLGDAAAALALGARPDDAEATSAALGQRLARPTWRNGTALCGCASAAIDISDGLLADLGHVLEASGVGATIYVDDLPSSDAFVACAELADRRRYQLIGGDDYELCVTLAERDVTALAEALGCSLTVIGTVRAGAGVQLIDACGESIEAAGYDAAGWDHFADG